jgi:CxxC motif-containing protein
MQAPKRTVTATCAINVHDAMPDNDRGLGALRRVPVKTSIPCPKEKNSALLKDIYYVKINLPVKAGDTVITNWNNSGIDVVTTRSVNEILP